MAVQKQDDQHEHTFSSYVRIRDVVLKTCLVRWTIGRSQGTIERVRDIRATSATWWWWYIYIYIYIYISNVQSASEGSGCGFFLYRIYEEYHKNLCDSSMYGYCYHYGIPDRCSNFDGLTYRSTLLLFLNISNTYCFDPLCPRLGINFFPCYS